MIANSAIQSKTSVSRTDFLFLKVVCCLSGLETILFLAIYEETQTFNSFSLENDPLFYQSLLFGEELFILVYAADPEINIYAFFDSLVSKQT
jgi:hypothetical protein